MSDCARCGKPLSECKYPISHSHPTANTVTLPAAVVKATRARGSYGDTSQAQREAIDDFEP